MCECIIIISVSVCVSLSPAPSRSNPRQGLDVELNHGTVGLPALFPPVSLPGVPLSRVALELLSAVESSVFQVRAGARREARAMRKCRLGVASLRLGVGLVSDDAIALFLSP